jgi:hypothetical protein
MDPVSLDKWSEGADGDMYVQSKTWPEPAPVQDAIEALKIMKSGERGEIPEPSRREFFHSDDRVQDEAASFQVGDPLSRIPRRPKVLPEQWQRIMV